MRIYTWWACGPVRLSLSKMKIVFIRMFIWYFSYAHFGNNGMWLFCYCRWRRRGKIKTQTQTHAHKIRVKETANERVNSGNYCIMKREKKVKMNNKHKIYPNIETCVIVHNVKKGQKSPPKRRAKQEKKRQKRMKKKTKSKSYMRRINLNSV